MKRAKIMLLLLMLIFGLCGCQMEAEDGRVNRRYVRVGEIEFVDALVYQQEGSNLATYQTRLKNNSKHIIRGLTIEVELENGRHTTIVTQDTLKPNDVSSWIRCVGPSSLDVDDIKLTRFTLKTVDDNHEEIIVTYDVERDFYTYDQQVSQEVMDPTVKVEEIQFVTPTLVEKDNGVMLQTYLRNDSNCDLQSVRYLFEDEAGETYTLFSPLEIKSQSQSTLLTASFLSSADWDNYQFKTVTYMYVENGTLVNVMYDVRLEKYFVS